VLVGRSDAKLRDIAERHGIMDWTTSLDEALATLKDGGGIYFDAQVTSQRAEAVKKALAAGAHVYVEKPSGATSAEAAELADEADRAEGAPFPHDLHAGARGVQVAELGLRSSAEGRRVAVPAPAAPARVAAATEVMAQ
jgi:hypothetical protein